LFEAAIENELLAARNEPVCPVGFVLSRSRVKQAMFGASGATFAGRFRVLDRLGAGGMGTVYRAHDPELDRTVALKLVRVREGRRRSALNEAIALARLSHPNVVLVHDVGALDEHLFIVMELVDGMTLAAWAAQPGRTPAEILGVYLQAAEGLAAAHRAGLVHRDFKPENVIVGADGRARVIDFGLACETTDSTIRRGGTPKYMPPENLEGRAPSPLADQYSFCLALREALGSRVPRRLRKILERGCAPDPKDRFASIDALLAELRFDRSRVWIAAALVLALLIGFAVGRHAAGSSSSAESETASRSCAIASSACSS
jgi:eukaryotic-like serine/threonine-protein kinase